MIGFIKRVSMSLLQYHSNIHIDLNSKGSNGAIISLLWCQVLFTTEPVCTGSSGGPVVPLHTAGNIIIRHQPRCALVAGSHAWSDQGFWRASKPGLGSRSHREWIQAATKQGEFAQIQCPQQPPARCKASQCTGSPGGMHMSSFCCILMPLRSV